MAIDPTTEGPLDRALAILDFVSGQRKPVTAAEIAQELDLPLPTAHRLVSNLEARQMLQRAPGTKRFGVGNRLVVLAGKTISSAFRTSRRHAVLSSVASEIGEQCEIGIVRHNRVVYVDSIRVAPAQGLQFDPGTDAPVYCTSTGKIYLSTLSPSAAEKLVRSMLIEQHTPNTITDPNQLLTAISRCRQRGWARTNEEYVQGVVGCAVPIKAPDGTLLACLGVSVPNARVTFEGLEQFISPLQHAAELLAETILESEAD